MDGWLTHQKIMLLLHIPVVQEIGWRIDGRMTDTPKNNVALAHLYNEGKWCSKFGWVPTSGLGALEEITWQTDERMQSHGGYLAFPNETILAIFDLQVTLMTPTKFQVNWLLGQAKKQKFIFKMATMAAVLISNRISFSYFFIYESPLCFPPNFEKIGLSVQEKQK